MLTEFKFCSGNLGSWNCYVLWNLPKSYFQQNQRYPFVPNVICRSMDKKLWSAEYSSCLSNPSLSLQNKPRWQQTNEQSHSSRCTHELSVLQVPCWGRRLDVAHHFFSFFFENVSLCNAVMLQCIRLWLATFLFPQDLIPIPNFHSLWYIHCKWNPLWPKGLLPNSWLHALTSGWFIEQAGCLLVFSCCLQWGFWTVCSSTSYSLLPQTNLKSYDILKP